MGVLPYAQCCWWKLEHGCSAEAITKGRTGEGRGTCEQIISACAYIEDVSFSTQLLMSLTDVCVTFKNVLMRYFFSICNEKCSVSDLNMS